MKFHLSPPPTPTLPRKEGGSYGCDGRYTSPIVTLNFLQGPGGVARLDSDLGQNDAVIFVSSKISISSVSSVVSNYA
jgi:hypothetical protein